MCLTTGVIQSAVHAEVRDLVEVLAQPGEVAAVEGALGGAVDVLVVAEIAVGEAVDDDEVEDGVRPSSPAA